MKLFGTGASWASAAEANLSSGCGRWPAWGDKRPSTLAAPRLGILGLDRRLHLAVWKQ